MFTLKVTALSGPLAPLSLCLDRRRSEAARAGESMTRSQIVVATVQAYGDVLTTHRMVVLYEQMVGQMEETPTTFLLEYWFKRHKGILLKADQ